MTKLLIVDDVIEYLEALSRALAGEYQVIKAATIDEAKRLTDDTIDLALVDVRLSEIDVTNREGIHLLSWLKQHYPKISVVMMSAYKDFDAAVDALHLGASRYLKKPINLRELKDLIDSLTKASE